MDSGFPELREALMTYDFSMSGSTDGLVVLTHIFLSGSGDGFAVLRVNNFLR